MAEETEKKIYYMQPGEAKKLKEVIASGGKDEADKARMRFVESLQYFARSIMRQRFSAYEHLEEDLMAVAVEEGILAHIDQYDPDKSELTTFFAPHIQNAMQSVAINECGSTHYYQQMIVEYKKKCRELDVVPSESDPHVLATALGWKLKRAQNIRDYIIRVKTELNDEVSAGELSEMDNPEKLMVDKDFKERIGMSLDELSPQEKYIVTNALGFADEMCNPSGKISSLPQLQSRLTANGVEADATYIFHSAMNRLKRVLYDNGVISKPFEEKKVSRDIGIKVSSDGIADEMFEALNMCGDDEI